MWSPNLIDGFAQQEKVQLYNQLIAQIFSPSFNHFPIRLFVLCWKKKLVIFRESQLFHTHCFGQESEDNNIFWPFAIGKWSEEKVEE